MKILFAVLLAVLPIHAETFTYWIEPCSKPEAECEVADEQLAEWAMQAWQQASKGSLTFEPSPLSRARIRLYWATEGNRGIYGEARSITVDGKSGAEVDIRPSLQALGHKVEGVGANDRIFRHSVVYLTCLHEIGHALGITHSRSFLDIMYSFEYGGDILEYFGRYRRKLATREDIKKNPGLSLEDKRRVVNLFARPRKSGPSTTSERREPQPAAVN